MSPSSQIPTHLPAWATDSLKKRHIDGHCQFGTPPAKRGGLDLELWHEPLCAGRSPIRPTHCVRRRRELVRVQERRSTVFYNGTGTKKVRWCTNRMSKFNIQRHDKKLKSLTKELGCRSKLHEKFLWPHSFFKRKRLNCGKGHIVPRSAGGTNWVVQRKDVDNFFGSFAGADFAHGLKLRVLSSSNDMLDYVSKHKMARKISLTALGTDGSVGQVNATHLGLRYVETDMQFKDVAVDGALVFNLSMEFPTIVTCLHSVHLGLFKLCGYSLRGAQDRTIYRVFGLEKPVSEV